jgi:hypothetical protein
VQAQLPVPAAATSVTSVTLTAPASVGTTAKWTPPAAEETVAVTAARASASASPGTSFSASIPVGTTVPLGPLPDLNGVSSSLIGASNAAGLFPAISPAPGSASPSPSAGVRPAKPRPSTESVAYSATLAPVLTAQVAGLVALGLALLLTVTRLSLRRRFRTRKQAR